MADADAYRADLLGRFRWIGGHADVLGLFADGPFLGRTVDALAGLFADEPVDLVAGIEARGFALAGAVATRIGAGFVPVRKPGAIHPGPKAVATTDPDWRGRRLELAVQRHAVQPGVRVLLVDDWAETGSQAAAALAAIQSCGARWVGTALLAVSYTHLRAHET